MNLTSIGLLVLIAAIGGVIAFFADRLGRTLGKKRLSLLGLRPRHTAELLTVGAGAIIPLITLAIVMAASSDVRRWIAEGPNLLHQRDQAVRDVKDLNLEKQQKTNELNLVNARNRESLERLQASQIRLRAAEEKIKITNAKVASLESQFRSLTANYKLVASRLRAAGTNLEKVRGQFGTLEKTYKGLQVSYSELHRDQQAQYKENLRLLRENEVEVKKGEELKSEYTRQVERLRIAVDNMQFDIDAKAAELASLNNQVAQARAQVVNANASLVGELDHSRLRPMTYGLGEEVARNTIGPGLTQTEARAALDSLLRRAAMAAVQTGASQASGLPPAYIMEWTSNGRIVTTREQEDQVVAEVTNASQQLLMVASAKVNAFAGEPVGLAVRIFPNPVVFKDGQTIAEQRVDGRLSEFELFQQIQDFLNSKVRDQAKRANMVLVVGPVPAIAVSTSEVVNLVKAIKLNNRIIRLQAQADGDIRVGGPLRPRFRIQ